jgi:hypothetical protein
MRGPAFVGAILLAGAVPWSSAAGQTQAPYTLQVNSRVVSR